MFGPILQCQIFFCSYPPARLDVTGYPQVFRRHNSKYHLPNARKLSNHIHAGNDNHFPELTNMVMQIGQFLDHDITLTAEINQCKPGCPAEIEMNCCMYLNMTERPKSCYPIAIPRKDAFFNSFFPKPTCIDFKRSQPYPCNYTQGDMNKR